MRLASFPPRSQLPEPLARLARHTSRRRAAEARAARDRALNRKHLKHRFRDARLDRLHGRKRQLIDAFVSGARQGTYWGIRTNIADYKLSDPLKCPYDRTIALAETPTRLKRMDAGLQERLINWGYAVCDAALRKHVSDKLSPPSGFPYALGV